MDIPKHIAIIMDGNGRWAKERNLTRLPDTKKESKPSKVIEATIKNKIPYLTLYAFSRKTGIGPKMKSTD